MYGLTDIQVRSMRIAGHGGGIFRTQLLNPVPGLRGAAVATAVCRRRRNRPSERDERKHTALKGSWSDTFAGMFPFRHAHATIPRLLGRPGLVQHCDEFAYVILFALSDCAVYF